MVQVLGSATTGNVYNDARIDLPQPTATIRPAHRPWCVDCKRTDRDLDTEQRCTQCARAAITRAAAAARRAAEAAASKLPKEGKQGKPTTRSSAPRATQTSEVRRAPGRAPGAGSSTHRKKNPPTVQDKRPATVGGTGTGTACPAARQPRRRSGPTRIQLPTDEVIAAYLAGQNLDAIGLQHGVSHMTIRRLLADNNVPRRRSPVEHTPELIEQVRHLYVDRQHTQVEIAQQIGRSVKVVQHLMEKAGIDRRAAKARRSRDNALGLKQRIADLGVTSAEIKQWAIGAGLIDHVARGLPPLALVLQYAAHHDQEAVA